MDMIGIQRTNVNENSRKVTSSIMESPRLMTKLNPLREEEVLETITVKEKTLIR
jgi:hypothetical protein